MKLIFNGTDTPIISMEVIKILEEIFSTHVDLVQKKDLNFSRKYLILMPGPLLYRSLGSEINGKGYVKDWYSSYDEPLVINNEFNEEILQEAFNPTEDDGI